MLSLSLQQFIPKLICLLRYLWVVIRYWAYIFWRSFCLKQETEVSLLKLGFRVVSIRYGRRIRCPCNRRTLSGDTRSSFPNALWLLCKSRKWFKPASSGFLRHTSGKQSLHPPCRCRSLPLLFASFLECLHLALFPCRLPPYFFAGDAAQGASWTWWLTSVVNTIGL